LKQNEYQYDVSPKVNEGKSKKKLSFIIIKLFLLDSNNDPFKTRLLERKQQQWKQENCMSSITKRNSYLRSFFVAEKMPLWNPFGRPGAGAPNLNENQARPPVCLLTLY
jgi:hypothetical protein